MRIIPRASSLASGLHLAKDKKWHLNKEGKRTEDTSNSLKKKELTNILKKLRYKEKRLKERKIESKNDERSNKRT